MSTLDQIIYRTAGDGRGVIEPVASSCPERTQSCRWQESLDPWLRAGAAPGRGYLNRGGQAALIRWKTDNVTVPGWEFAYVLAGPASTLTPGYALQLPELTASWTGILRRDRLRRITDVDPAADPGAAVPGSRSPAAVELLVPMLSRILAGDARVTLPWTERLLPEAALWDLVNVLDVLGDDRSLSFMTYAVDPCPAPPGLFISFHPQGASHPQGARMPLDPVYGQASIWLATTYAASGRSELQRILAMHRILEPADQATRIARLLELWPGDRPPGPVTRESTGVAASPRNSAQGGCVICPICLSELDWHELPLWRWEGAQGGYVPIKVPEGAGPQLRSHMERGGVVRCPNPHQFMEGDHYLPADYGRYGPPVVLGFVGLTKSGKSHLLTAMVSEIEGNALEDYGIKSRPIDPVIHRKFLSEWVYPLIRDNKVLSGTAEGVVTFADAFLITPPDGAARPVALFDVAGGELVSVDKTKQFLQVADGLIFVVDPEQLDASRLGDEAFNAVLDLLKSSSLPRLDQVSAAIVVNKADMVRFEDPITGWLRSDSKRLDVEEIVRESADVYAYLDSRDAGAWTRPYSECAKATLHVASPTGGSALGGDDDRVFARGVTPCRVLRPLVALLAMTGVLTGAQAERVGI